MTQVVSDGAGLYVIDRKVGLCLAYQPATRRKLRAGDSVEVGPGTGVGPGLGPGVGPGLGPGVGPGPVSP